MVELVNKFSFIMGEREGIPRGEGRGEDRREDRLQKFWHWPQLRRLFTDQRPVIEAGTEITEAGTEITGKNGEIVRICSGCIPIEGEEGNEYYIYLIKPDGTKEELKFVKQDNDTGMVTLPDGQSFFVQPNPEGHLVVVNLEQKKQEKEAEQARLRKVLGDQLTNALATLWAEAWMKRGFDPSNRVFLSQNEEWGIAMIGYYQQLINDNYITISTIPVSGQSDRGTVDFTKYTMSRDGQEFPSFLIREKRSGGHRFYPRSQEGEGELYFDPVTEKLFPVNEV